jgi:hypothetical protein
MLIAQPRDIQEAKPTPTQHFANAADPKVDLPKEQAIVVCASSMT